MVIAMMLRVRRHTAVVLLMMGLVLGIPLGVALADHQFSDVINDNPFHADIDALVDAGVTSGCGGGKYCPSQNVTREQMAAFLNRLGALAPGKTPVVNATKLDGIDSTGFMTHGPVVTSIGGSAWQAHEGNPPTSGFRNPIQTAFSGDGNVLLALVAPTQISGVEYGLASLQICFTRPGAAYIFGVTVNRALPDGVDSESVFDDPTDRLTSGGCFSVAPMVSVGDGLGISIGLTGGAGSQVILGSVKATWSSTGPFN